MAERPRCPELSCPVRYAGGLDRLCPDHGGGDAQRDPYAALRATLAAAQRGEVRLSVIDALSDDGEAQSLETAARIEQARNARIQDAAARRARQAQALAEAGRTPVRRRIVAELLADPRRISRVIAAETQTSKRRVQVVRGELEAEGIIPVYRAPAQLPGLKWTPLQQKIRAELLADPRRISRVIGEAAGTAEATVGKVRRALEAEGIIPRCRARLPLGMDSATWQALQQQIKQNLAADIAGGGGSYDVFSPLLAKTVTQDLLGLGAVAVPAAPDRPDSDQPDPADIQ